MTPTMAHTMIGNTKVLRNTDLDPISDKQLKDFSPTVFAKGGITGVSDKYGFVSTIKVIEAMRDTGFDVVEVRQSQKRGEDADERMNFTKHMLKFRKTGQIKKLQRGDVVHQVVMLNSHDRSSGFHLYGGLFRLICSNGMMCSDSELVTPIKVPHTINMVRDVIERSIQLVKASDGVYQLRDSMLAVGMTERQQNEFAKAALEFRPPRRAGLLDPKTLLAVRRPEDEADDLWHVFNRVQENMLRGGNDTVTADGKHVRTRGIGRIERDVEVNTRLWSLAVQTIAKAAASSKKAVAKKAKAVA
jgi:hypothetical protein